MLFSLAVPVGFLEKKKKFFQAFRFCLIALLFDPVGVSMAQLKYQYRHKAAEETVLVEFQIEGL